MGIPRQMALQVAGPSRAHSPENLLRHLSGLKFLPVAWVELLKIMIEIEPAPAEKAPCVSPERVRRYRISHRNSRFGARTDIGYVARVTIMLQEARWACGAVPFSTSARSPPESSRRPG